MLKNEVRGRFPTLSFETLFLIGIALSIFTSPGLGQITSTESHPALVGFDTDDGLSHNSVYAILQDQRGFLWLGTEEGLNRYDGHTFKTYRHRPESDSLSSDDISFLLEDQQGFIWIATFGGGLNRFDPVRETFQHFRAEPDRPDALPDDQVISLFEDRDGFLWVGTFDGGLSRFDAEKQGFERLRELSTWQNLPNDRVWSMVQDGFGTLWLATEAGLVAFHPGTQTPRLFRHEPENPQSLSHDLVRAVHLARDGTLWIGTRQGLNRFDPASETFERFSHDPEDATSLPNDRIYNLHEDRRGRLWIGTATAGLFAFDPATDDIYRPKFETSAVALAGADVRIIFEDRSEILWIGTRGNGFGKLDLKPNKFHLLPGNMLSSPQVRALAVDPGGHLWIGTQTGVDRFDGDRITNFRHRAEDPRTLPGDEINDLLVDRQGRIWISVWRHGLSRFIDDRRGFVHFLHDPDDPSSFPTNLINDLEEAEDGSLWIGSAQGLIHFDPETGESEFLNDDPTAEGEEKDQRTVSALLQDRSGPLWIGTRRNGLSRFDLANGSWEHLLHNPEQANTLSANRIYCLFQDPNDRLWIGTAKGLDEYLPDGTIRRHAALEADIGQLPQSRYFGIRGDRDGGLWLSTHHGLWHYRPKTGDLRHFTVNDGLQGEEFRPGAYAQDAEGQLFFGGQNGINFFRPEQVQDNPHQPKIALTDLIDRQGNSLPVPDLDLTQEGLRLSHRYRSFGFRFAVIELTHPSDNRYRYRLDPFDFDWQIGDGEGRVRYFQVPPGRYTFRVQASNGDLTWAPEELAVRVRLLPPFWQTWWWRLGSLTLALLAIAGFVRFRTRQMRLREEQLARRVTESLADLQRSEQRYRSLFERNLAGVLRADTDGQLLDCNAALAEMLGYEDPKSCRRQHNLVENNEAAFADLLQQLRETGEVRGYEQTLRHRDGESIPLLWNAHLVAPTSPAPAPETKERQSKILEATVIDISERRRFEEGLRRGQKLESLGILAGGIAHDFNNILMGILGHAEIARHHIELDSPARESIQGIEKAANRAAGLANQMLAYSGKGRFERQHIDLSRITEEVASLLRPAMLQKVQLRFGLAPDLPPVEGDPAQLDQVILNLLTNAIEAVADRPDAEVVLTTGSRFFTVDELRHTLFGNEPKADHYVYLEVRDNGQGMTPEVQQKIFDPFFSTKFTGRGLGLSAVLGIIRSHHGTIFIDSTPQAGTCFRVLLPAVKSPKKTRPRRDTQALKVPRSEGMVLIIDDEEPVRTVTSAMVEAFGFSALTANGGLEGVATFHEHRADIEVVLIDLTMPDLDGEATLRKIRQIDPNVPVILMSGFDDKLQERRFESLQVDAFIQKPFRLQTLRAEITQLRSKA